MAAGGVLSTMAVFSTTLLLSGRSGRLPLAGSVSDEEGVSPVRARPRVEAIEQLSTRVAYQTPYLRMREDQIRRPDGSDGIYSYVDKPDFALVIAAENSGFHLVEQYRYPVRERSGSSAQGAPGMAAADDPGTWPGRSCGGRPASRPGDAPSRAPVLRQRDVQPGVRRVLATGLTPGTAELELEEQDLVHRWFPRAEVEDMIPHRDHLCRRLLGGAYSLLLLSEASGDADRS
jgi:hypothetical protein